MNGSSVISLPKGKFESVKGSGRQTVAPELFFIKNLTIQVERIYSIRHGPRKRRCVSSFLVASDKRTKSLGLSLPSARRVMSNEEGVCEALRGRGVALSSRLS